ncbi:hypothetical protein FSP39_007280 [Pinctada imbricata]|uniref:Ataxin-2 C-terminal domain-containing protein n=1 Tax=Pinctada imbricata TaxID=66713 RepID=A0AA88XZM6_PINIB|nr:hypothetical protein FSP39_007280 [Pinctada imbricata]
MGWDRIGKEWIGGRCRMVVRIGIIRIQKQDIGYEKKKLSQINYSVLRYLFSFLQMSSMPLFCVHGFTNISHEMLHNEKMNMRLPDYLQDEIHQEDQMPHINVDVAVDYSEYVWMGEEELEDFDRQVEEEFWEEAFLEACFEEMLEEEEAEWQHFSSSVCPPLSSKPCDIKNVEARSTKERIFKLQSGGIIFERIYNERDDISHGHTIVTIGKKKGGIPSFLTTLGCSTHSKTPNHLMQEHRADLHRKRRKRDEENQLTP